ncbi:glucuronoxylanase [Aliifodinibius salicampi]|uniref:Glucuronoxylanase n=1 Tax=Fodinibius salicampi TaxID=1920655 RepID=A0ABT3PUH2_9BACT|nr:glucuronoxylanase [Fodinibius salicampi]MCW9711494.1 glucuronoxylanase [Fodinibius salicampi]
MMPYQVILFLLLVVGCENNNPAEPEKSNEIKADASTINLAVDEQIIRGFGAANIVGWRPDMTNSEIEKAFGAGEGQLGFTILRLKIHPDPSQWQQSVSAARKAYNMGVKIIAAPWNAPDDMLILGTEKDTVAADKYDEYAAHLESFRDYMSDNGVPIYAISIQNEPDYANTWTGWSPEGMLTFMKNHADVIDTRIMAPESFQFRRNMSDPILNDPQAVGNIDIVGGHIYGGGLEPYPLAEEKGKEVWMTEHYTTSDRSGNLWPDALEVGHEIHQVMRANMNAYIWWYIVRYYGPIGDGEENRTKGEITKRGYVMSHYSRFVRPGYHRLAADENPKGEIYITAYQGDDKVVVVAVNMGSYDREQQFVLENRDRTIISMTPYVTSETQSMAKGEPLTVSDEYGTFTYEIPTNSIVTFVEE